MSQAPFTALRDRLARLARLAQDPFAGENKVAKAAPAPRQRVEDIRHRSAELGCLQPTLVMLDRSSLCELRIMSGSPSCDNRCTGAHSNNNPAAVLPQPAVAAPVPSPGKMGPTVIDKSKPIELVSSRFRNCTRTVVLVFAHGPTLVEPSQGEGYRLPLSNTYIQSPLDCKPDS